MKKTVKSPRSNLKLSKRKIVPMNELPLDIDTTADVWNDLPQVRSKLNIKNMQVEKQDTIHSLFLVHQAIEKLWEKNNFFGLSSKQSAVNETITKISLIILKEMIEVKKRKNAD